MGDLFFSLQQTSLSAHRSTIKMLETKIRALANVERIREDNIFRLKDGVGPSVRDLCAWIEQNRHEFQGQVLGPVCLHIHVEGEYYKRVVEQHVAWRYQACTLFLAI